MIGGFVATAESGVPPAWLAPEAWAAAWPSRGPAVSCRARALGPALLSAHRCGPIGAEWFEGEGLLVAFWGRLDNRPALDGALSLAGQAIGDARRIAAAWQRWRGELPAHLVGDFALAVFERTSGSLFLARDPVGVKPLYLRRDAHGLMFAGSVAMLRRVRPEGLTPDEGWMARHLMGLSASRERTAFTEIDKLPPGHCLLLDRHLAGTPRRWHHWRDDPPPARTRDPRWVEAYREQLFEAVRCRMGDGRGIASETSGGLDSSTVTVLLGRLLGDRASSLTSLGCAVLADERESIELASQSAGAGATVVLDRFGGGCDDDDGRERMALLEAVGYPIEHLHVMASYPLVEMAAARGAQVFFAGFGGDEAVTQSAQQLRCELIDTNDLRNLWQWLGGPLPRRALRFAKAMTLGRRSADTNRSLDAANRRRWPMQVVAAEAIDTHGLKPAWDARGVYDAPYRRINSWIVQDLIERPYIACRLEGGTLTAAQMGMDHVWPLFDARLVQQYLSSPSIEKCGPAGLGRYLHRRAVDGIVPSRITWRAGKSMGEPVNPVPHALWCRAARREAEAIHPRLAPLVDRQALGRVIERVAQSDDIEALPSLQRHVRVLACLRVWLDGLD